jgi:hypothetical protein
LRELEQRFARACAMLEAEASERRKALEALHQDFGSRLAEASRLLGQAKASREELAELLSDVADRLRHAAQAT